MAQAVPARQAFESHCGAESEAEEERIFSTTLQSRRGQKGGKVNEDKHINAAGDEKPNLRCLKTFLLICTKFLIPGTYPTQIFVSFERIRNIIFLIK